MRKHYHVISGMRGYMPDRNEVCATRKEAIASAEWWIDQCLDDCDPTEGDAKPEILGSKKEGFWSLKNFVGVEYVEINDCDMSDCLKEGEICNE